MEALWIALTVVVACFGGWPVTAGILRLSQSHTVAAIELSENNQQFPNQQPENAQDPAADSTAEFETSAGVTAPGLEPTEAESSPPTASPHAGVLRGGLLIGMLERAAVVLAILSNQPVAIAYVVAIKGLGRYPELKGAPAASERFIIGTLASLLWAAAVTVLAKVLLL
ncbi:hypothetical protein AOC05_03690 [Arthrobacter alpinus]|uniref:Uncharacterized protein n=1 Tax=Arthrobacter alpinus TaxID=656366 RepID=A0A0M4QLD2_9MICC|nr:hypothetical protein [Arthrobacter alpinus]ALE91647.1 hypothetical protein AOC05_03690 [Arthrobacter alpinus]